MTHPPVPDQHPARAAPQDAARRDSRRIRVWAALSALAVLLALHTLFQSGQELSVPPQATVPAPAAPSRPDSLLDIQKARNEALAREIDRLREALQADPCSIPSLLGSGPERQTVPHASSPAPDDATPGGPAPAPRTVAALLEQSTVFILSLPDGKNVRSGTGFLAAPGIIATNAHVVGAENAIVAVINKALGKITPARVFALSREKDRDYALLRIAPETTGLTPLTLNSDARRTDRVSAWGFPGAISSGDPKLQALLDGDTRSAPEVVYSEGVISVLLDYTPPVIVHTAVISQGNSGGPLVNDKGEVLGINTMISLDKESYRQSGLSLSSGDLAAFMREHGVAPAMAQVPSAP